jgi:NAD(P) transhydrogenase subunit alpha
MKVCVVKERASGERRVALTPDAIAKIIAKGLEVHVESGAGAGAFLPDEAYSAAGATVSGDAGALLAQADLLLKVQPPTIDEASRLREGAAVISSLPVAESADLLAALAKRRVTAFSVERLPRITRAQAMDVLSSQATIAGYKAVLLAAAAFGRVFPLLMTPAGTLAPTKVFVIGAGVAGLQAIATARRLGATVSAFDVRPAVKEQVKSLGAAFVEVALAERETEDKGGYAKQLSDESHRREQDVLAKTLRQVDVAITTALIPGRPAPRLISAAMVRDMKPGSVIVDLAASAGGNCELTEPGREVVKHDVTIIGTVNLAATVPVHASQMYARNLTALLGEILKDGALAIDFQNEIVAATCVTHAGEIRVS